MPAFPAKTNYAAGDILTAAQMVDVGNAINALNGTAGKNKIINGDFRVWQRGTSFSTPANGTYTADRFFVNRDGSGTVTCSQQSFTAGTAPVTGYEGQFFFRWNQTVAGTGGTYNQFVQRIEDVRTFAGQTVTLSFWAKADASRSITVEFRQEFGSGGSGTVVTSGTTASATTSWARYTSTVSIPSISGKTIGTGSSLGVYFGLPVNAIFSVDIWGVQLEAGSTATDFTTCSGSIQGELALCQRYYWRWNVLQKDFMNATAASATLSEITVVLPTTMRTTATGLEYSNIALWRYNAQVSSTGGTVTLHQSSAQDLVIRYSVSSSTYTIGETQVWYGTGSGSYLAVSAEL